VLFGKIAAVYFENRTKHLNIRLELLIVKVSGKYSYHWAVYGQGLLLKDIQRADPPFCGGNAGGLRRKHKTPNEYTIEQNINITSINCVCRLHCISSNQLLLILTFWLFSFLETFITSLTSCVSDF
jgi:hypothetical protein